MGNSTEKINQLRIWAYNGILNHSAQFVGRKVGSVRNSGLGGIYSDCNGL